MKESKKQKKNDQSIKAMLSFLKYNWKPLLPTYLASFLANISIAVLPYFVGRIAGLVSEANVDYGQLKILLIIMVALNLVHSLTWRVYGLLEVFVQTPVLYKVRDITQKYVWGFKYEEFVQRPSGKVASALDEVYAKLMTIFIDFGEEDIDKLVRFPVFIGILFLSTKENAVLFSVFLIILVITSYFSLKRVKSTANIHSDMKSTVAGRQFDSISNFVNVKSFNSESVELRSLSKDSSSMLKTSTKRNFADEIYWASADLVIRWGLWISFAVLNLWLYSNGNLSVVGIVTAVTVLQQFTNSIWEISGRIQHIATDFSEYKQNYNYLFPGRNVVKEYYQDLNKPKLKVQKPIFDSSISFNNLNFAYPDRDDTKVLKNINLTINKNEKVGIVGKSGSGKTTLIKLLLGFYDYEDGAIQVDGKPLKKESLGLLNSYVPQDTTLFQQSIAYNIAYAKNGKATKKEIIAAAKKAHAHEFINSLPDKYETLVGERGIKLSLGQRQRIAIARAFLKHSDLLILDEATSALDSKTEKLVQDSLEKLWKDKTVVAIAHRLSTLNNVNRIIVMDAGRIVESGTKAELLSQNGIFTDLWKHQKDGLIID
ncbi:ABC transporter ATP-binding protein [Candidatus Saccharibacteria bacterium]|jgi:ATP-binding cassette subfamily B protein|nr:ABC transporter ATP-binding protein [Candidatus Saccharibacteria bacterium]